MHYGDRISQFMERIGGSDRIFIFLSDKYLRSAFCMHELFDVWRNCRADDAEFIKRTRAYLLPCANIRTFSERAAYVRYWREQLEAMEEEVARHGLGALAQADLADYRHMQDFVSKTPDMLRLVLDVLGPWPLRGLLKVQPRLTLGLAALVRRQGGHAKRLDMSLPEGVNLALDG